MKKICYDVQMREVGRMINTGVLSADFDKGKFLGAEAHLTNDLLKFKPVEDGILMSFYEAAEQGEHKVFEEVIDENDFSLPIDYLFQTKNHILYQLSTLKKIGEVRVRRAVG